MADSLDLPQIIYQPFAATGDKNTILQTPSEENPQLANLQTGFPAITQIPVDNGGIPAERADFNGLGYLLSSFYYFTQNGGTYTFNQDIANAINGYPKGARLYYKSAEGATFIVESLINNNNYNFVTNPSYIDGQKWLYVSTTPVIENPTMATSSNVFSANYIKNKFQVVSALPQNPSSDVFYFVTTE